MASHSDARHWATDGFKSIFGREPTLLEVQFIQAVALLESGYGAGWKGEGIGSWNMGAVQAGRPPCDPARSFQYTDSHPNADGTSTSYTICFRKYPGPVEGMADVARILYKQMSIKPTSIRAVSTQMYEKHYYEGFGPTKEVRINNHIKALTAGLTKITAALNEPMPPADDGGAGSEVPKAPSPSVPPQLAPVYYLALSTMVMPDTGVVGNIHEGMFDSTLVRIVQSALKDRGLYNGKLDGDHGPKTEAAIRKMLG